MLIDNQQVSRVAQHIKQLAAEQKLELLNFYSFTDKDGQEIVADHMYPPLSHPQTVNFFFFACMHMFRFWYANDRTYEGPITGTIHGKVAKGSDLIWQSFRKHLISGVFEPENLCEISPKIFAMLFQDDNGLIVLPDFEKRYQMTLRYARYFIEQGKTPTAIVIQANHSEKPFSTFLRETALIPGFSDTFRKKNILLAMALANRPEHFLRVETENFGSLPPVDYHLMRMSGRLGLTDLVTQASINRNEKREIISQDDAEMYRATTATALREVVNHSGVPMPVVDALLWMGRRYCPEILPVNCEECLFNPVCLKRVNFFQPIDPTTTDY